MPIRPNKLGGIGNGSNPPAVTVSASRPPSTSLAHNLVGQYHGVTLSPLTENVDSSFDSFDSADSADTHVHPAPIVSKEETNKTAGVVAARANFFSNGAAINNKITTAAAATLPVRPAPAAPVSSTPLHKAPTSPPTQKPASTVPTLGHTEIIIAKTIVPVSSSESITKATGKPELPPKGRPLSTPNTYNVKAIFNRAEPAPPQPIPPSAPTQPNSTSTLQQKVASLFKASPTQTAASTPDAGTVPDTISISESETSSSTLPRNQSIKATKINRESLRGLEISNPILQNTIELPSKVVPVRPAPAPPGSSVPSLPLPVPTVTSPTSPTSKLGTSSTLPRLPKANKVHFAEDDEKGDKVDGVKLAPIVERSESMRLRGVTSRPNIPQFGSMRAKRPLSMPFTRPTSPPPNPPSLTLVPSPIIENDYPYDDCSRVNQSEEDAIYASIEDLPRDKVSTDRDEAGSTTTSNSDGLLSEIVCELKKKNTDVYSVTMKNKASTLPEPPKPIAAPTAVKTTAVAPVKSGLIKSITSNNSPTVPVKSTPSTATVSSAPTTSTQGYKPYSSSMASRGRYLGTGASTAATTNTTESNNPVTSASLPSTGVSATKPLSSTPSVPVTTSSATQPKDNPISVTKPTAPLTTLAEPVGRVGSTPAPLPLQPPIGKLPLTSKLANNVTEPSTTGSTATGKPSVVNGSKRLMSPDKETISAKPGAHQPVTAAAKSKSPNSKITTASPLAIKTPGAPVKSGAGVPKIAKPSTTTTGSTLRSAANSNVTTTVSSSKPTTSIGSSNSTSSPGGTTTASCGKNNSSSHVLSMQQKFDTSNALKGPIVSASSNKSASAISAKSKSNPKR